MKVRDYKDVTVAVLSNGSACLVSSPAKHLEILMVGPMFEDNSRWDTMLLFPKEPGVYSMTIEYEFEQGYLEGYPNDGESSWDFIPKDIARKI